MSNITWRKQRRWFRKPIYVMQVEVEAMYTEIVNNKLNVTKFKYWRDVTPEDNIDGDK